MRTHLNSSAPRTPLLPRSLSSPVSSAASESRSPASTRLTSRANPPFSSSCFPPPPPPRQLTSPALAPLPTCTTNSPGRSSAGGGSCRFKRASGAGANRRRGETSLARPARWVDSRQAVPYLYFWGDGVGSVRAREREGETGDKGARGRERNSGTYLMMAMA